MAGFPRLRGRQGVLFSLGFLLLPMVGCTVRGGEEAGTMEEITDKEEAMALGPRDGQDLSATDLDRVAIGSLAPDFSLVSLSGDTVTLSAFRGAKNVVLVFYRGHW